MIFPETYQELHLRGLATRQQEAIEGLKAAIERLMARKLSKS
jgi:hypothetical protein